MIIAIATEGENVSGHFGRCENFTLFEIFESTIKNKNNLNTSENQHGALPAFLKSQGVQVVILGGLGSGAKQGLVANGIEVIAGISGNIDTVINQYLAGNLESGNEGCRGHGHSHDDNHESGGCNCGHN